MPFFGGPTGLHRGGLPAASPVLTYGNSTTRMGVEALRPKAGTEPFTPNPAALLPSRLPALSPALQRTLSCRRPGAACR